MKLSKIILISLAAVVIISAVYAFGFYNSLVAKSQNIEAQWAQVETQYQRRFDLIPNLVNSVKGLFEQEQTVFGQIAEARTRYSGAQTTDDKAQAAGQLESALSRLLVIVENYPEIQSSKAVQQLMDDLAGTENRISVERRRYNELTRDYNTAIQRLPGKFLAQAFGFNLRHYFEAAEGAETAPAVKF